MEAFFFLFFFSLFACFYFSCLNSFLPLSSSPPYSISSLSHYVSLAGLWQCEYPLQRVQPDWSASLWRPINSKQTEVSFLLHLSHITQTSHRSTRTVLDKSAAEGKLPCWAQWVPTDALLHCSIIKCICRGHGHHCFLSRRFFKQNVNGPTWRVKRGCAPHLCSLLSWLFMLFYLYTVAEITHVHHCDCALRSGTVAWICSVAC